MLEPKQKSEAGLMWSEASDGSWSSFATPWHEHHARHVIMSILSLQVPFKEPSSVRRPRRCVGLLKGSSKVWPISSGSLCSFPEVQCQVESPCLVGLVSSGDFASVDRLAPRNHQVTEEHEGRHHRVR